MTHTPDDDPASDPDAGRLRALFDSLENQPGDRHDETVLARARDVARARRHRRWSRGARLRLAMAAVATLAALTWVLPIGRSPPESTLRGSDDARGVRPAAGATLDAPPRAFEFPPAPGATTYRVVLRDGDATVVWTSPEVAEPLVPVPDAVAARLEASARYLWSVHASGPGGATTLGPFEFRLR